MTTLTAFKIADETVTFYSGAQTTLPEIETLYSGAGNGLSFYTPYPTLLNVAPASTDGKFYLYSIDNSGYMQYKGDIIVNDNGSYIDYRNTVVSYMVFNNSGTLNTIDFYHQTGIPINSGYHDAALVSIGSVNFDTAGYSSPVFGANLYNPFTNEFMATFTGSGTDGLLLHYDGSIERVSDSSTNGYVPQDSLIYNNSSGRYQALIAPNYPTWNLLSYIPVAFSDPADCNLYDLAFDDAGLNAALAAGEISFFYDDVYFYGEVYSEISPGVYDHFLLKINSTWDQYTKISLLAGDTDTTNLFNGIADGSIFPSTAIYGADFYLTGGTEPPVFYSVSVGSGPTPAPTNRTTKIPVPIHLPCVINCVPLIDRRISKW